LAIVNGRVARTRGPLPSDSGIDSYWAPYVERNQLFAGDAKGTFRDISRGNKAFCGSHGVSRGLVWGDLDGDGRVDLVVSRVAGPARFYRNIAERNGHWLMVRAVDPALHRDAYGARVTVHAGSRRWVSWVNPGQSYLCSGDPRTHFGLGNASSVERVQVLWPDGLAEDFAVLGVDRLVQLERGKGRKVLP
jgi:hypothetical protein